MKRIKLLCSFFSEMTFPTIVVGFVMTASMFIMTFVVGNYQYVNRSLDYFEASSLENAVYYMIHERQTSNPVADMEYTEKVIETIRQFDCVASVMTDRLVYPLHYQNDDDVIFLHLYSEDVFQRFPIVQSLDTKASVPETDGSTPVFVIGNARYRGKDIGDSLELYVLNGEEQVPFHTVITGISQQFTIQPGFGGSATYPTVDHFIDESTALITKETPELLMFFKENSYPILYPNVFVEFKSGADNAECLSYMLQNGMYADYDEIIRNTKEDLDFATKRQFSFLFFFLFITTIALFSVAILFLHKKMRQYSIYYICGCSRKRCNRLIVSSLGLLSVTSLLLNYLLIALLPTLRLYGIVTIDNILLDWRNYLYAAGYAVFTLLVIFITQHAVIRRDTPMTAVRRFE